MLAAAEKLAAGGAPPQEPCASDRGRPKEAEASSAGDEAVKPREAETAALQREVLFMAERLRVLELDNELLRREAEESRHALEPLAHHRAVVLLLEAANEKVRAHEEHICFLDAALSKAELRRAKAEARADKARAALLTKEHELGGAVLMQRLVEMKKGFGPILNAPPGATSTSTRATATSGRSFPDGGSRWQGRRTRGQGRFCSRRRSFGKGLSQVSKGSAAQHRAAERHAELCSGAPPRRVDEQQR
jgi:hypothetical protein